MSYYAANVEVEDESDVYAFMASWYVSVEAESDAEVDITCHFTGDSLDYTYDVAFVYGAPDSDDSALEVNVGSESEEESGSGSGSGSESKKKGPSMILIIGGIVVVGALAYFFLM